MLMQQQQLGNEKHFYHFSVCIKISFPSHPGMSQQGAQGMQPNQGQGLVSQQTPALVAQLQRQMPNQPGGMMNQQYSQQPY